jgi:hypothetical protein
MLCHQHPADSAHAACQRCQRGLCRSCAQQFLPRLCTHCIEESVSKRTREARRTLWLALPVFTLAAWLVGLVLPELAPRPKLFVALLAGMGALGSWFGLRRWRRAPALAGGIASLPESETPFLERVLKPALAGIVFWPWLLVETLRDMQLASRLRAFVPAEDRASTFGFGEASLAFVSLAAAFTLGAHGLSTYTPVAAELWSREASLAASAQDVVRAKLTEAEPAAAGSVAPQAEPQSAAQGEPEPPGDSEEPAAQPVLAQEPPAAEPPSSAPPPLPEVPAAEPAHADTPPRSRRERRKGAVQEQAPAEPAPVEVAAPSEPSEPSEPAPHEQAPPAPPPVLDRRYVPGSEMAKQVLSGSRAPDGSYVTSSGRVVIKAPPPTPK